MASEGRYRRDFTLTEDPQVSFDKIYQHMITEGFEYLNYEGEQVFKKGKGFWTGPTFIKVQYTENQVRLEAWIKYAILPGVYVGEYGMEGFVGAAAKGPMKKAVAWIEASLGGAGNALPEGQSQIASYPQPVGQTTAAAGSDGSIPAGETVTKAEYRRKYAPAKFHKDIKGLCIGGYVLLGISTLVAVVSNPVALVDTVLLLVLVLMVHLRKSKGCAIGLLAYSIFNCIMGIIAYGTPAGYLWIILSIAMVVQFNKVDKQYKEAMSAGTGL